MNEDKLDKSVEIMLAVLFWCVIAIAIPGTLFLISLAIKGIYEVLFSIGC